MRRRRKRARKILALALMLGGAARVSAQTRGLSAVSDGARRTALERLHRGEGPERFAEVSDALYRGGQPTEYQLELLRQAGVETIVDLRRGDRAAAAEEAVARRLGMRFLRFPFYGPFGAAPGFLEGIVSALRSNGRVYVHCQKGRDRTSLVVALYRVFVEGWEPLRAWEREALAFGYRPGVWYGAIQRSFFEAVRARAGRP